MSPEQMSLMISAQAMKSYQVLKDCVATRGIDTTGEGGEVPAGHLRVLESAAAEYSLGFEIVRQEIPVKGIMKLATLVRIEDFRKFREFALSGIEAYPKPCRGEGG
jgi:hypothetical protein